MKIFFAVLVVFTMASLSSAQQSQTPADVIFVNGDIYPGAPAALVWASAFKRPQPLGRINALAVAGGEIVAAGSNEEMQKFKGPNTQVIDLGGHFVMPGFND